MAEFPVNDVNVFCVVLDEKRLCYVVTRNNLLSAANYAVGNGTHLTTMMSQLE